MSKLHYQILGTGEPLVMLHGWAMHSGIWQSFAERLAEHYQVICIDLPGHGYSEPLAENSLAAITGALLEVIPVSQFKLLGWSLGAILAIDLAARAKDRVTGLMLLAANPCFVANETWPGVDAAVLEAFAGQLALDVRQTLWHFLALQVTGLDNAKRLLVQLRQLLESRPFADPLALQAGLAILECGDVRFQLRDLSCPVVVILGGQDKLVPVAVADAYKHLHPAIEIRVLQQAGHVAFLSDPDQVLPYLLAEQS